MTGRLILFGFNSEDVVGGLLLEIAAEVEDVKDVGILVCWLGQLSKFCLTRGWVDGDDFVGGWVDGDDFEGRWVDNDGDLVAGLVDSNGDSVGGWAGDSRLLESTGRDPEALSGVRVNGRLVAVLTFCMQVVGGGVLDISFSPESHLLSLIVILKSWCRSMPTADKRTEGERTAGEAEPEWLGDPTAEEELGLSRHSGPSLDWMVGFLGLGPSRRWIEEPSGS